MGELFEVATLCSPSAGVTQILWMPITIVLDPSRSGGARGRRVVAIEESSAASATRLAKRIP